MLGIFLASRGTVSFSRTTLLLGARDLVSELALRVRGHLTARAPRRPAYVEIGVEDYVRSWQSPACSSGGTSCVQHRQVSVIGNCNICASGRWQPRRCKDDEWEGIWKEGRKVLSRRLPYGHNGQSAGWDLKQGIRECRTQVGCDDV